MRDLTRRRILPKPPKRRRRRVEKHARRAHGALPLCRGALGDPPDNVALGLSAPPAARGPLLLPTLSRGRPRGADAFMRIHARQISSYQMYTEIHSLLRRPGRPGSGSPPAPSAAPPPGPAPLHHGARAAPRAGPGAGTQVPLHPVILGRARASHPEGGRVRRPRGPCTCSGSRAALLPTSHCSASGSRSRVRRPSRLETAAGLPEEGMPVPLFVRSFNDH